MKYSEDLLTNEQKAQKLGERELITWDEVYPFIGNDAPYTDLVELLMDVVNGIYSADDLIKDAKEYAKELA